MPIYSSTPRERREATRDLDRAFALLTSAVDASLQLQDEVDRLSDALIERSAQLDDMNAAAIEALKLVASATRDHANAWREIQIESIHSASSNGLALASAEAA